MDIINIILFYSWCIFMGIKQHLNPENLLQSEQNDFDFQEYNEEEQKKQLKEIEDMKLKDSEDRNNKIKDLINWLNEEPEIEQRVIDLFNQLKKEENREEYLQKYVKNYLDKFGYSYDSEISSLVSKYSRRSITESLDFHDNVSFFNSAIQNLKQDIENHIQKNNEGRLESCYNIGRVILETSFWKKFKLIWKSGKTWVYLAEWDDTVYKFDTLKLEKALEEWKDYCDSSKSNEKENKLFQKMQEYFPDGSVLAPQNHEKTIKLDKNLINQLGISNTNLPENFTFLYTTTPLAKEIGNGSVGFNLSFWQWHMSKLVWNDFVKNFESGWVTQEELNTYFDKNFEEVIQNIKKLSNDEWKIKEFLKWLIKFSDENDIVLDIYWTDNFTFYLDSDWNLKYHIIDPFMPWNRSRSEIEHYKGRWKITKDNIHARSYEYIMEKIENYCK